MDNNSPGFSLKTVLGIGLVFAFWFGWQWHLSKKYPRPVVVAGDVAPTTQGQPSQTPAPTVETKAVAKTPSVITPITATIKTEKFENPLRRVEVISLGGKIGKTELLNYHDREDQIFKLFSAERAALIVDLEDKSGGQTIDFSNTNFDVQKVNETTFKLTAVKEGYSLEKQLTFSPASYGVDVVTKLTGDLSKVSRINFSFSEDVVEDKKSSGFLSFLQPHVVETMDFFVFNGVKEIRDHAVHGENLDKKIPTATLASLSSRYFTALFANKADVIPDVKQKVSNNVARLTMSYPVLATGTEMTIPFKFYAGPKKVEELASFASGGEKVLDLGMFSFLGFPMMALLKWFQSFVLNWGVAIILLTLVVRLVTFPFTYFSMRSMQGMQKIQPEIARIKERYKGDRNKLNQATLELMRQNKVNPMGGCLPMLLQIPVFLALWQVLQNSIELYHAPFFGWIHDLSAPDPWLILPILMAVTMFLQQKLTPTTMDPDQARVMMFMPVIFSFFMVGTPSGLTLYIFVSTLFGIIQQVLFLRSKNLKMQPQAIRQ